MTDRAFNLVVVAGLLLLTGCAAYQYIAEAKPKFFYGTRTVQSPAFVPATQEAK